VVKEVSMLFSLQMCGFVVVYVDNAWVIITCDIHTSGAISDFFKQCFENGMIFWVMTLKVLQQ
jgi:hypothetical protein